MPYGISCFRPGMKAVQFFAWFQSRTGRGGVQGPPSLLVSLPNVIPRPRVVSMARHSEEDFRYTGKLIIAQCEKAESYRPSLREFTVFITDPTWVTELGVHEGKPEVLLPIGTI